MAQIFCIFAFVIILAGSEGTFGPGFSSTVRTYFNFLDCNFGRGSFMLYICILIYEKTAKGEDLFALIATIIAVINMVIGYKDRMKELPSKPWGDRERPPTRAHDEEKGLTKAQ